MTINPEAPDINIAVKLDEIKRDIEQGENWEGLEQRIEAVEGMLISYPEGHEYLKILYSYSGVVHIHFELVERGLSEVIDAEDFTLKARKYSGSVQGNDININAIGPSLYLFKTFIDRKLGNAQGSRVKIKWVFDHDGRINTIVANPRRKSSKIYVLDIETPKEFYWNQGNASYCEVPQPHSAINSRFSGMDPLERQNWLLNFGYETIDALLKNLPDGVVDSDKNNVLPLSAIVDDPSAMYIMRNMAEVFPKVEPTNEKNILQVKYMERK